VPQLIQAFADVGMVACLSSPGVRQGAGVKLLFIVQQFVL
jgi:hypothetical protein